MHDDHVDELDLPIVDDTTVEDACTSIAVCDTMDSMWNAIERTESALSEDLPRSETLRLRNRLHCLRMSYDRLERTVDIYLKNS